MEKNLLYAGTIFELYNSFAYNPAIEKYILADSQESGYVFQIINIAGFNAGNIVGYIREDQLLFQQKIKAVSFNHFKNEIKRNFGEIDTDTIRILGPLNT